jgi:pilus assembly protein TadC
VLEEPLATALTEVSTRVALGADEAGAWSELASSEPAIAALGREVARAVGSGVALAGTLRALGAEARRQVVAAAQVRARRVGVASVLPLMTCFLPSFLLLGVVPIIGGVVGHLFG